VVGHGHSSFSDRCDQNAPGACEIKGLFSKTEATLVESEGFPQAIPNVNTFQDLRKQRVREAHLIHKGVLVPCCIEARNHRADFISFLSAVCRTL
jgi:hypothetical protein